MKQIQGIICALVTPLDGREEIDREAVRRLVRHVLHGGVSGIIALGSTGEQIALSRKAKCDFISIIRKEIPVETLLIVGAGAVATRQAVINCRDAKECGADAVIVTPPCFYLYPDASLVRYYEEIVAAVDLPLYLYNISRFTKLKIPPEVVRHLAGDPRIVGIKESDRDLEYLQQLLAVTQDRPGFSVIQGSDRLLLESFEAGCPAGVAVSANLIPEFSVQLYREFSVGNLEEARKLQAQIREYVKVMTRFGRFPAELKTILAWVGLATPQMTSPFLPLDSAEAEELKTALAAAGLRLPEMMGEL